MECISSTLIFSSNISGSGAPCCQQPCCPPPMPVCTGCCPPPPHPICCMPCPPPLVLPTLPEPVKPLMMPVEKCEKCSAKRAADMVETGENENREVGTFYNNYGIDYREEMLWKYTTPTGKTVERKGIEQGVTLSGQSARCPLENKPYEDKRKKTGDNKKHATNNIPCMFKFTPSPDCSGAWCVEIKSRPDNTGEKIKKTPKRNEMKPCTRPCCKHWKLKEGECQYDLPCKAACFNHPPGMKPKYHVPEIDYELLKVLGERYNNPTN
ncbi:uncharacterized protein LOC130898810 isoform X2 [Diorhabda carinulata]|uniref:uncharacterized protein LOC130898810 isoform X2 n=1 Tax=Diorhabda carinulata TaxID=1163345 RepID=UPI0025A29DBE|nr:uncharacterized protein LOC130898810 isoform X2 [Diorhabda carinulata]